ncbi:MAG: PhoU domain-containing protein [bacterium]|nr:PhoU domain-containing protein [bacterium]
MFRSKAPLGEMGEQFYEMLRQSLSLLRRAGDIFFRGVATSAEREEVQQADIQINKLQRRIRKQVIVHLSVKGNSRDLPYCLLLMSLVKDAERLGDYAKDLVGLTGLSNLDLPDDEITAELREIRSQVEGDLEAASEVIKTADRDRAIDLIRAGRDQVSRCEALIPNIAHSSYSAGTAATLGLAARFYMRISGHVLNLLSSIVMPLHKLDYYDEKDIARAEKLNF